MLTTSPTVSQRLPLEERRRALDLAVLSATQRFGWRLVTRTETEAQLVTGNRTSHLLHLVLSVITVGLWLPVWIVVAISTGEKHLTLAVDDFGTVADGKRGTNRFAEVGTVAFMAEELELAKKRVAELEARSVG